MFLIRFAFRLGCQGVRIQSRLRGAVPNLPYAGRPKACGLKYGMLLAPSLVHRGLMAGTPGIRSGRTTTTPLTDGIPFASPSVGGNGRPLYRLPTELKLQP